MLSLDFDISVSAAIVLIALGLFIYYLPSIINGFHEWRRMND